MSEYDARAWLLDALTHEDAIENMPPDMVEIIKDPTKSIDLNLKDLLNQARIQIKRDNNMSALGRYFGYFENR